jgi:hypothetical protein
MKCDFIACPLGVYRDITFMEPENVNETLRCAMVLKSVLRNQALLRARQKVRYISG